jgi:hypothetical protein
MQIFGLDLMADNTHKSELVNWLIVKGTEGEGPPSARVDLRSAGQLRHELRAGGQNLAQGG